MKDGYIQQVDSPQELYDHPVNLFVAGFIGSPEMNFINAKLDKEGDKVSLSFGEGHKIFLVESKAKQLLETCPEYIGKEVIMGIRPENIHDEEMFISSAKTGIIDADVEITEMMGAEVYLYLNCQGISLTARVDPRSTARPQDTIKVALDPNKVHIFDKETEKTIVN